MKDTNYISQATHELNYVLKKYGKRQTKGNRSLLQKNLAAFRQSDSYTPHKRKLFYKYIADTGCFEELENRK